MCKVGQRCNGYLSKQTAKAEGAYTTARDARKAAFVAAVDGTAEPGQVAAADRAYQTARYELLDARIDQVSGSTQGRDQVEETRTGLTTRAVAEKAQFGQSTRETLDELDDVDGALQIGNRARKEKALTSTGVHPSQVEELPEHMLDDRLEAAGIHNP